MRRKLLVFAVLVGLLSTLVYQGAGLLEVALTDASHVVWGWVFASLVLVVLPGGLALALWLALVGLISFEQASLRRPGSVAVVLASAMFGAILIWFGVFSAIQGSVAGMIVAALLALLVGVTTWVRFSSPSREGSAPATEGERGRR
ncbi:hypothetical protein IT072_19810 [Leifsonia sp. ZF2019]|uniref:hypothetical protein n=1 Tax=Leifsonia sp. ZF2019 TaxID=2781978 RepID=UPI001CBDEC8E|nr:hypothetical protein [Leifsonia sp. ZF2019]UAJ79404.1 hypothetical protein IT072_19810 [Leifsonia sp. ZF2019]